MTITITQLASSFGAEENCRSLTLLSLSNRAFLGPCLAAAPRHATLC